MDSDKAAVWVTNWDTERNGSSLTTRDGTSYLLANAFMLAYDYGQPHIFSGYYYAGVDDGAPGATRTSVPDMTCPTDGIETDGTWHCAQRWTAIRGMIGFRNVVAGTFTATVAKGSAVALYAGATPANWAGTRKYDPSDPAWFTGETPHKGDAIRRQVRRFRSVRQVRRRQVRKGNVRCHPPRRNARRHPPARHRRRHVHGDSSQERQSPVRQQRPE